MMAGAAACAYSGGQFHYDTARQHTPRTLLGVSGQLAALWNRISALTAWVLRAVIC
jgi:hypothetical protein